jgi:SAM-dependent methyltransferase
MQGSRINNVEPGFSSAAERNKQPILDVLRDYLEEGQQVLEVGSGTGQHAVFFARSFPGVQWQPTDTPEYLPGLQVRLAAEAPPNIAPPLLLDVRMPEWPMSSCDILYSANTLHFMSTDCVEQFFRGAGAVVAESGLLIVYGPFNYGGEFTSPGNAAFDQRLKGDDPLRGIRDFEWVDMLARAQGMALLQDVAMPANNRMLIWRKAAAD